MGENCITIIKIWRANILLKIQKDLIEKHKIIVPEEDEDGVYFLELEQIYVCFIYKIFYKIIQ